MKLKKIQTDFENFISENKEYKDLNKKKFSQDNDYFSSETISNSENDDILKTENSYTCNIEKIKLVEKEDGKFKCFFYCDNGGIYTTDDLELKKIVSMKEIDEDDEYEDVDFKDKNYDYNKITDREEYDNEAENTKSIDSTYSNYNYDIPKKMGNKKNYSVLDETENEENDFLEYGVFLSKKDSFNDKTKKPNKNVSLTKESLDNELENYDLYQDEDLKKTEEMEPDDESKKHKNMNRKKEDLPTIDDLVKHIPDPELAEKIHYAAEIAFS